MPKAHRRTTDGKLLKAALDWEEFGAQALKEGRLKESISRYLQAARVFKDVGEDHMASQAAKRANLIRAEFGTQEIR